MSDPSLVLQAALVAVLKNADVVPGKRVYDAIPPNPTFPYVTLGDDQVVGDDEECGQNSEVFVRIHGWSRPATPGYVEVKGIAIAIRNAVSAANFTLSGFTVVVVEFIQHQYLQDPDGQTRHSVSEFRFLITHA